MASTEKRGGKTQEAVLAYCTSWTQGLYLCCWPTKGAGDATMEVTEDASLAVSNEMMAMLRHEIPEQDDTASASEPMRGDNESDLKSAAWQGFDPKFPDAARFDEPAPVLLWVEGKPDDGMPRREVTQDELRHLRFYPERDELSGGGLKFKGLLFFNAAERLPVDGTTGSEQAVKQEKSRRNRSRDVEMDAKRRSRIRMVLAIARREWPNPKNRPEIDVMAKELERQHKNEFGYKFQTIRKILKGTYEPSGELGISGL